MISQLEDCSSLPANFALQRGFYTRFGEEPHVGNNHIFFVEHMIQVGPANQPLWNNNRHAKVWLFPRLRSRLLRSFFSDDCCWGYFRASNISVLIC